MKPFIIVADLTERLNISLANYARMEKQVIRALEGLIPVNTSDSDYKGAYGDGVSDSIITIKNLFGENGSSRFKGA